MEEKHDWKRLCHLPMALLLITFVAIIIGGTIRINDAGESCPDWPRCFGTWGFDVSEDEQQSWYLDNPDEIDSRGQGKTYTTFEIFIEWFHRLWTGLILGPLCILQWVITFRKRREMPAVHRASGIALCMVIFQGILGYFTVKYDNIHWSVAAHLLGSMALSISLLWAWIRWMEVDGVLPKWMQLEKSYAIRKKPRLYDLSISTLLVMLLGSLVAAIEGANQACSVGTFSAWPLCHGGVMPDAAGMASHLHITHRFAVLGVGIWLITNLINISKDERTSIRPLLHAGVGFYMLNVFIGGAYLLTWDSKDGFVEHLSLFHLILGSFSFLSIAFAALLAKNSSEQEILLVLNEEE
ncbi:MAG: COX15/CtaA family protein [Candidatus Thalassarchaeaceae archaeon]|jgi:cytochrome c oxidase assembly protein subunit 15|nr:COX15/CtaA family protein [Candidatus Thalassarchaeaceae archaeon]